MNNKKEINRKEVKDKIRVTGLFMAIANFPAVPGTCIPSTISCRL